MPYYLIKVIVFWKYKEWEDIEHIGKHYDEIGSSFSVKDKFTEKWVFVWKNLEIFSPEFQYLLF